jgi:hypothetical protein
LVSCSYPCPAFCEINQARGIINANLVLANSQQGGGGTAATDAEIEQSAVPQFVGDLF